MGDPHLPVTVVIHQIYFKHGRRFPQHWLNTWQVDFLQKFPEWSYVLWDESSMNEKLNIETCTAYEEADAFDLKADIARYHILHKYGGIYVDADVVYLTQNAKSFDTLLEAAEETGFFAAYVSQDDAKVTKLLNNAVIGSKPGHSVVEILIE